MKLLDCSSLLPKQKAADILKNYSDKFTIESDGGTRIGAYCERIFYRYLLRDVNEEEFDELYSIADRNYKGILTH